MNEVFETEPFSKMYEKLDNEDKKWIEGIKEQLKFKNFRQKSHDFRHGMNGAIFF